MKAVRLEWRYLRGEDALLCRETDGPFRHFLEGLADELRGKGARLDLLETPLAPGQQSQHHLLLIDGIAIEKWDVDAAGNLAPCGSCADPTDADRYLEQKTESGRTVWRISSSAVRTMVLKAAACLCLILMMSSPAFASNEVKALREKLAKKQSDPQVQFELGVEMYNLGYSDDAVTAWKRSVDLAETAEAHYYLGKVYFEHGDNRQSLYELKRAVEIRPDYAIAQYALGRVHLDDGRLENALACWVKATHADPDLPEVNYDLARLQFDLGHLDDAIASFKKELRIRPNDADSYFGLGMAYADKKNYGSAVKALETYLKRAPQSEKDKREIARSKITQIQAKVESGDSGQ